MSNYTGLQVADRTARARTILRIEPDPTPLTGIRAAALGPYTADCPQCMDIERRFGSKYERDLWVHEHRRDTCHRVRMAFEPEALRRSVYKGGKP